MRRSLFRLLPILSLLLLSVVIPAGFVAAQGDEWECLYDFTVESEPHGSGMGVNYAPAYGRWDDGLGWAAPYFAGFNQLDGEYTFHLGDYYNVTGVTVTVNSYGAASLWVGFGGSQALSADGLTTWTIGVDGSPRLSFAPFTLLHDTGTQGGVNVVDMYIHLQSFLITGTGTAPPDCEEEPGGPGGDLTMPLASEDQEEDWGLFDLQSVQDGDDDIEEEFLISDLPYTVYGFSQTSDAKVSSVTNGTVIDVQPHSGNQCFGASESLQPGINCSVFVPAFLTEDDVAIGFNVEVVDSWIVTIEDAEDPDVTYSYLVADVEVSIGDAVVAGCVLGRTLRLKPIPVGTLSYFPDKIRLAEDPPAGVDVNGQIGDSFTSYASGGGVTTVVAKLEGEPVSLYPFLSVDPDESSCAESTLTNCTLDNPDLQSDGVFIEGWNTVQATSIDGGGVHLGPSGSIYQQNVTIRGDISYTLTVLARVTTPIDSFYPLKMQVGSEVTTQNISEGKYQRLTWTFSPMGITDLPLVGVFNETDFVFNSEVPVEVDIFYICLSPDTASVSPGACVFVNNSFDAGGTGWIDAGNVSYSSGQATLGDGAIIDHATAIILHPIDDENPASYTIVAVVRLNASAAYTGQSLKQVEIKYRYPESPDVFNSLGIIDSTLVDAEGRNLYDGTVNTEHAYVFSDTFEIDASTSGLFSFGVLVTDTEGYIQGLRIDSLCLKANTDDGSFPGFPGDGGFDPPFIENCSIVPTPIDNNISSWTFYHWKNLSRFFNCTLMIVLNDMAETIDTAWKTTRLFMRWCVVLVNRVGDWFTTLLWWLGGHFRNIAIGQVTTVYESGGGTCSDLFCVLEALITGLLTPIQSIVDAFLSILGGVAGLLLDIVGGLVSLLVALITQLLGFLQLGQQLLGSVVTAYNNATPVAVEGIPQCSIDPRSSAFCMGIWILDNTIFSGTGTAIIPVLVGILSIHLLIWVVGEFKRTVTSVGGVT